MIFLTEDTRSSIAIIGDEIAYFLQKYNTEPIDGLVDMDMSIRLMFKRLSTQDTFNGVQHVVLSIGSKEYYSDIMDVSQICNLIKEIFPNSNYYIIEGFLISKDLPFINEKDIEEIEKKRLLFYDEFESNDFEFIGTGKVMSYEPLDMTNTKLLKVIDFVSQLKFEDISSFNIKKEKVGGNPFVKNLDISGDDKEDFSTIYEFLDRFEEIVNSGNFYKNNMSKKYSADVHQIEIALSFLMPEFDNYVKYDGIFDDETEDMIMDFQKDNNLSVTGIADEETLEEIFYSLKVKGFDDDDLGKYLGNKTPLDSEKQVYLTGRVDYSRTGLSSEQQTNVQLMIDYMIGKGILNPYTQIGILSTCGKESGFIPKDEICYNNTSDSRIKEIFGDCRTNDFKIANDWGTDSTGNPYTITTLKKDCEKFFDAMYGKTAKNCLDWDTGNDSPGDGYRYRGRGFNGLTFKSSYEKYGNLVGESLVSDPEKMNDVNVAAKVAVEFF
jgi:predicted chitinase/peptidoglycan hydrolase-like protein with peptidoglycan-binding domain